MERKIMVVAAEFHKTIADSLVSGACSELERLGIRGTDISVVRVPGAFELPLMCAHAATSDMWDAIVALGAVVKGETPHFDYVCNEASRGIMNTMLETGIPIGFGLLTTHTLAQAEERAGLRDPVQNIGGKEVEANKGVSAARAVIQMLDVIDSGSF